jgi:hypothetical protein
MRRSCSLPAFTLRSTPNVSAIRQSGITADLYTLGLHQGLGKHLDAFPQDIGVVFFQKLAYKSRDVHPGLGHCHLLI